MPILLVWTVMWTAIPNRTMRLRLHQRPRLFQTCALVHEARLRLRPPQRPLQCLQTSLLVGQMVCATGLVSQVYRHSKTMVQDAGPQTGAMPAQQALQALLSQQLTWYRHRMTKCNPKRNPSLDGFPAYGTGLDKGSQSSQRLMKARTSPKRPQQGHRKVVVARARGRWNLTRHCQRSTLIGGCGNGERSAQVLTSRGRTLARMILTGVCVPRMTLIGGSTHVCAAAERQRHKNTQ